MLFRSHEELSIRCGSLPSFSTNSYWIKHSHCPLPNLLLIPVFEAPVFEAPANIGQSFNTDVNFVYHSSGDLLSPYKVSALEKEL